VHAKTRSQFILPIALTSALGGWTAAALAQDGAADAAPAGAPAANVTALRESVDGFVHAVMIAKPEAAMGALNAMLDQAVSGTDLAIAVDDGEMARRVEDALRRSRSMPEVADSAAAFEVKLESGRRELARKSARIDEAVAMLVGPMRGQVIARDRLLAAGEYAVPSLLRRLTDGRDPGMDAAATRMLVEMRRQASLPLSLSLASLDPAAQRKVCAILGQLGYPVAVPFLLDLAEKPGTTDDVASAARAAVRALGGADGPAHAAYASVAFDFLSGDRTLAAFPEEAEQNVWRWTEFGGLAGDPISTGVYYDAMAMALSRRALELDPSDRRALAVFLAADLRRETATDENTLDPLFGGQGRSAAYFATAAGPSALQDVLQIGLDLKDVGIVRSALAALRETAGVSGMVADGGSAVIKALDFGDRRVRIEAALALASVSPTSAFPGSEQVVPLLTGAIRGGGSSFGGIISGGSEDAQRAAALVQSMGMVPMAAADDASEFDVLSSRNSGADVVVITGRGSWVAKEYEALRASRMGATVPAVLVTSPADKPSIDRLAAEGKAVVLGSDISDEAFRSGVGALVKSAMGGRETAGEGSRYLGDAIDALSRIGMANGPVYRLADGESGLLAAMRTQEGPVRTSIAALLAMVDSRRAQGAVIDAALAASGDDQVLLLQSVAQGARRFGPRATDAQADAIRDLVRSASGANADAAAAAFGALRLPSSEAVDLILKARVPGKKPEAAPVAEPAPSDAPAGDAPSDGAGAASSEEPAMAEDPAGG
jgi:hypothetical protein